MQTRPPLGNEMNDPLALILSDVEELGRLACEQQPYARIRTKHDGTPVTSTDEMIEAHLANKLRAYFPLDGIYGEEGARHTGSSGDIWYIDPIDGTVQYTRAQDTWGIILGRIGASGGVGIINLPARDTLLQASTGNGCFNRKTQLMTSGQTSLAKAYLLHNGIKASQEFGQLRALENIALNAQSERGYADCFGHVEVISGKADCIVDAGAEPQDVVAVATCLEEAGGAWALWPLSQRLTDPSFTFIGAATQTLLDEIITFYERQS